MWLYSLMKHMNNLIVFSAKKEKKKKKKNLIVFVKKIYTFFTF